MLSSKPQKKSFLKSRWASILGGFICLFILSSLAREYIRAQKIDDEINHLKSEIARLQKENQKSSDFVEYLKTDRYFEEQARLKLGLKSPGEKVVVLKEEDMREQTEDELFQQALRQLAEGKKEEKKASPAEKWYQYFFGA